MSEKLVILPFLITQRQPHCLHSVGVGAGTDPAGGTQAEVCARSDAVLDQNKKCPPTGGHGKLHLRQTRDLQATALDSLRESTPTVDMIEALPAMCMSPPDKPIASMVEIAVAFPLTEWAPTKLVSFTIELI